MMETICLHACSAKILYRFLKLVSRTLFDYCAFNIYVMMSTLKNPTPNIHSSIYSPWCDCSVVTLELDPWLRGDNLVKQWSAAQRDTLTAHAAPSRYYLDIYKYFPLSHSSLIPTGRADTGYWRLQSSLRNMTDISSQSAPGDCFSYQSDVKYDVSA